MRPLALLVVLAGCPGGGDGGDCTLDTDCSSSAQCARNGECLPASEIRMVRVTWTIRGMTASDTTCGATRDFYLKFLGTAPSDEHGYAPVPCRAGLFTVDKLPRRFVSVVIGADGRFEEAATLDANGNAAFDLFP
jgi:hypothetical protein